MNSVQAQSIAPEEQVRGLVAQALVAHGGRVTTDQPGSLVVEVGGSKLSAYLAGGLRNKMKMPMLVTLSTTGGPGGTGLLVEVRSRGTGGGAASGGLLGTSKQGKGERAWMEIVMNAIPERVGSAAPPTTVQGDAPPMPSMPPPPGPPVGGGFTS